MKKLFVLAGAVLAALAINANVVIDLSSTPSKQDATITPVYAGDVLTVNYDFTAAAPDSWPNGVLEFPLDNLTGVTGVAVSIKGSDTGKVDPLDPESADNYAGLHVYLLDVDGKRWVDGAADIQISAWKAQEFTPYSLTPNKGLWSDVISGELSTKTFVAIGFAANTQNGIAASYQIKGAGIYTQETGLESVKANLNTNKMIKNGKMYLRDGKGEWVNVLGF